MPKKPLRSPPKAPRTSKHARRRLQIRHRSHKNILLACLGLVVAVMVYNQPYFHFLLHQLGELGYIGAFFSGILFVMTPTIAIASVILAILAEKLPLVPLTLIAGCGAVVGDVVIFRFIKNNLLEELTPYYKKIGGKNLTRLLYTRSFSWLLPLLGIIIIASPLPDELGVTLLGISNTSVYRFIPISFVANVTGLSLILGSFKLF